MVKMSAKIMKTAAKSEPLVQNCFIIHVSIKEDMRLIDQRDGWVGPSHMATPPWFLDPSLVLK